MQSDYTFAQYTRATITSQAAVIKQRIKQGSLMRDVSTSGCVLYTAKQPLRLIKLTADLTTLAFTAALNALHMRKAEVVSELVTSNLGHLRSLSAASRGPFKLCGRTAQLLSSVLLPQDPPASPSPVLPPTPSPSPSPKPPKPSPSPSPGPSGLNSCLDRADDPACRRCARQVAMGIGHVCVLLYDGSVECAGSHDSGQLGRGGRDWDDHPLLAPAKVLAGIPV